jgi:hypothetical protein
LSKARYGNVSRSLEVVTFATYAIPRAIGRVAVAFVGFWQVSEFESLEHAVAELDEESGALRTSDGLSICDAVAPKFMTFRMSKRCNKSGR